MRQTTNSHPSGAGTYGANTRSRYDKRFLLNPKTLRSESLRTSVHSKSLETAVKQMFVIPVAACFVASDFLPQKSFITRINVFLSFRDIALIAASRFDARLRLAWDSWYTTTTGRRLRV